MKQRRASIFVSVVMMLVLCGFLVAMSISVNLVTKQSVRQNLELEQAREIAQFVSQCIRAGESLAAHDQISIEVAGGRTALATITRNGQVILITATYPADSPSATTVKQELKL
ncbi:MAG: hypothetical protein Aurels2KO_45170 [Aureliella sp.]